MSKILKFPRRDPYADFTSHELKLLLKASVQRGKK